MEPINRRLSRRLTPLLMSLRLTPNQVTLFGCWAGLMASWCFLQGTPRAWLFGAAWFQLAYLLDNCDGEIARITGKSSGFGSWLDTVTDCVIHVGFFTGLGIGVYRYTAQILWLKLGLIASTGVFLSYIAFLGEQFMTRGKEALRHPDPPAAHSPTTVSSKLRKIFREDFSFIVMASALVQQMSWLLWSGIVGSFLIGFYGVFSIVFRGYRLLATGYSRNQ